MYIRSSVTLHALVTVIRRDNASTQKCSAVGVSKGTMIPISERRQECLCLPSGNVGSILGKATSITDYWSTVKQTTNKQSAAKLKIS